MIFDYPKYIIIICAECGTNIIAYHRGSGDYLSHCDCSERIEFRMYGDGSTEPINMEIIDSININSIENEIMKKQNKYGDAIGDCSL